MQQNERKSSRTRSPRGKSPSGRMSRWPWKDYLKRTCNNSFCEKWHPPESMFYKTKCGCRFGEKCSFAHRQVDEQPTKRSKKNDDKSAVAMLQKGDWQERGPVTGRCHVKGMYLAPHVHEHFTIHKWLRQTAYILTHNLNMLEHIANNGMNTTTHTDANIAQF